MARQKIMIVDDEEYILRSTQLLLEVLGYDAVTLRDPQRVVEVAAQEHPDLILHDLKMPAVDIPGMVSDLRRNPETKDIPFAFFSASPNLPETAAQHDAEGFLQKPFREEELVHVIDRAILARHLSQRGEAA